MKKYVTAITVDDDDVLHATITSARSTEEVAIDLTRHDDARALVAQLAEVVVEWPAKAADHNCGNCVGACCMRGVHEIIQLTDDDITRLSQHLKLSVAAFKKKYTRPINSAMDFTAVFKFKRAKKALGGACCPFLGVDSNGTGRCTVYEARPRTCVAFDETTCLDFVPTARLRKAQPIVYRGDSVHDRVARK